MYLLWRKFMACSESGEIPEEVRFHGKLCSRAEETHDVFVDEAVLRESMTTRLSFMAARFVREVLYICTGKNLRIQQRREMVIQNSACA